MKFFFDRNMPIRLARIVGILDHAHKVVHHDNDERFNEKTTDIEWMRALASDSDHWIVISGDGRILKNKAEFRALRESELTFFCLSKQWPEMDLMKEYAWKFVKVWPDIVANADITRQRVFQVCGGASLKVEERFFQ